METSHSRRYKNSGDIMAGMLELGTKCDSRKERGVGHEEKNPTDLPLAVAVMIHYNRSFNDSF